MGCLCSKGARDDANVTSENRTPKDDSAAALVSNDGGTTDLCAKIKESRAKPTGTSQPSDNIGDLRGLPSSEHVAAGWPAWLVNVAPKAVEGWLPRRANSFEKLAKVKLYIIKLTRCARIRLGCSRKLISFSLPYYTCRLGKGPTASCIKPGTLIPGRWSR
jgi:hypothetical protein